LTNIKPLTMKSMVFDVKLLALFDDVNSAGAEGWA